MNNKLFYIIVLIILFVGIYTKVAYAKGFDLFCLQKQDMIVILKDDANIEESKNKILEIPQIKTISVKYKDKEWSKMVNKYDLPKMENPFKNEFTIKTKKNTNLTEVYDKLKEMDFVEDIKYASNIKYSSDNN